MPDERPIVFDEDNPEWTAEDFARARPVSDLPSHIATAFPKSKGWHDRRDDLTRPRRHNILLAIEAIVLGGLTIAALVAGVINLLR